MKPRNTVYQMPDNGKRGDIFRLELQEEYHGSRVAGALTIILFYAVVVAAGYYIVWPMLETAFRGLK